MNASNVRNIKRQNRTQNYESVFITSGGSSLRCAPSFYHVLPKPATGEKVTNLTPQTEASGTKADVTPSKPFVAVVHKSTGNQCCKSGNIISKTNPSKKSFFVLAGQKKKRRRRRWSSGIYIKKKLTSPHTPNKDAQLAAKEDGNDEDPEKGGRGKQRAMDVTSESTPAEGSRIELGGLERLAISVDNSQESRTGVERGNREPSHSGNDVEAQTATGNEMVSVEEEEPTQMATPGTRRTVREDPSTGEMASSRDSNEKLMGVCVCISESLVWRMTKKNVVMQQQMINMDEAVQNSEQETPPLVVNRNKLKVSWMTAELI